MGPLSVYRVEAYSPALEEALGGLLPQLSPRLSAPTSEWLQSLLSHPATALFVARIGERPVGMLTLVWYDVPSGRKAWIEDVVVDAAARGCGAGRALVDAALRLAARALYRSCGFNEAETTVFVAKTDRE